MAVASVERVLARVRRGGLDDLPLAPLVEQLCGEIGHRWRDRLLTPVVTLRLFVLQVLHGNTAISHLRHLAGLAFSPGSYCEARERLPLQLLQGLLRRMGGWAEGVAAAGLPPLPGVRVLVVDGSTASMPDAPGLRERFGLPAGQRAGVGYPMARLMGLLDAATGLFAEPLALPLFTHDMRGAAALHPSLRHGDVLLGDRAFCSFAHFALPDARGVAGCSRLHQRREATSAAVQQWKKPPKPPAWTAAGQYARPPATLAVRLVRYAVEVPGCRTNHVTIATTLLDEAEWPDDRIAALYGQRWPIETCFNHLKTTLKMDVLKSKSVDGVLKELAVYLIVYNLVRPVMLKAAQQQGVAIDRVGFADAARALAAWAVGLVPVVPLVVNPRRPGRHNPRVVRRRRKKYTLMTKPRAEYRQPAAGKIVAA